MWPLRLPYWKTTWALLLLLFAALAVAGAALRSMGEHDDLLSVTRQVQTERLELEQLSSSMKDLELGLQSALVGNRAGDPAPSERAITQLEAHLDRLAAITRDDALQYRTIEDLTHAVQANVLGARATLQAFGERGRDAALAVAKANEGPGAQERFDALMLTAQRRASQTLLERDERAKRANQSTFLVITLGSAVLALGALVTVLVLRREYFARTQSELRAALEQQRYRSLVDATSDVVWTASSDGRMVPPQPAWSRLTGQTDSQLAGLGFLDAVAEPDRTAAREAWMQDVAAGRTHSRTVELVLADGEPRTFEARAVPVREDDGTIREWVGVHTDITERVRVEREREALIGSLERSNAELDQFAYVASHDLKAPLRAIGNLSAWIEEDLGDTMTAQVRNQMELLRGRVHRLEELIDGILTFSRAGRVKQPTERVDVNRLVSECVELLAPQPPARVEKATSLPTVEAQKVPLQQVWMNLLSNALKYSGRPDALVSVAARDEGAAWRFAVKDNGPGIAPKYQSRIWGIFQTLDSRDKTGGTGIGLAVVKKMVESVGGRTWVESAEGAGATFYFTWPKRSARR